MGWCKGQIAKVTRMKVEHAKILRQNDEDEKAKSKI